MHHSGDRISVLEDEVAALRAEVAALTERVPQQGAPDRSLPKSSHILGFGQDSTQLSEEDTVQGTLTYEGEVQIAGKQQQTEQQEELGAVFENAPHLLAPIFAAFANPHRIVILRALYHGPRTGQQLADILGMSTTGQLYHHLKELLAVRLIIQRGRSLYSIDPTKAIPIGIALMVASHLMPLDWRLRSPAQETDSPSSNREG